MGELGDRLMHARESRGLTLEDAERDTRISRRYLQALEAEQFEVIPAPVYARGFLRSYSQYLGLDPQEMLALFPSEEDPAYPASYASQRASREHPIPGVSPSRPVWRRPQPTVREEPLSGRPTAAQGRAGTSPFGPRQTATPPGVVPETPSEPTIGIDIGVPVPARRINPDPAGSTRTLVVLGAAILAIALVVGLAYLISRMGGGGGSPGEDQGSALPGQTAGARTATRATPAAPESSGLNVQRGVVPDVIGHPVTIARLAIAEAGLAVTEQKAKSPNVARGNVIDQSPVAGAPLPEGQTVRLIVSDGP